MKHNQLSDPETWVEVHGDYLYGYSLSRLRDPGLAEDLVQETFLAALKARENFSGRSSERTWIFGILKHKIIDHIRKISRERPVDDVESYTDTEEFFDEDGGWKLKPKQWNSDPATVLEGKEFLEVFKQCLSTLPSYLYDAFSLREMEGLNSKEVCEVLSISESNLWVRLHRARLHLRHQLEINWLGLKKEEAFQEKGKRSAIGVRGSGISLEATSNL